MVQRANNNLPAHEVPEEAVRGARAEWVLRARSRRALEAVPDPENAVRDAVKGCSRKEEQRQVQAAGDRDSLLH